MKLDPRLLRLARLGRAALFITIASGFLGGLLVIAQARLLTGVINDIFLDGLTLMGVRGPLGILLTVIFLRAALSWLGEVAANRLAGSVKGEMRHRLLAHLFARGPLSLTPLTPESSFARSPSPEGSNGFLRGEGETGELVHTLAEGIEALDAYFSQYLPQIALALLVPVSILIVVFSLDPLSGLVLLFTGPLIPFFMALIGSQADAQTRRQWQLLSRLSARFLDALQGLATLKLLGRSKDFAADLARASDQYRQATMSVLRVTFLSALTLELIATISTALVAVEIGLRLLYGYVTFEQAFFVLLLAPEFYLPLRMLGTRFHAGMAGAAAGERIFGLFQQPVNVKRETNSLPLITHHASPIAFDHVSYTYPNGSEALRDITFTLQPGTLTALTGPTGSGKSTIISLLLGFIHPTSGQIQSAFSNQQSAIAWVPQHPYLFNDSVAANLRLARPDATDTDLIAAARLAHADEFIQALPQGYETVIGERGARLSGGQAQRLALARAFLMDAPILILDEPTAQLDSTNEALILESARRLAADRIVLIIAHRPATIASADQVIRLQVEGEKVAGSQVESYFAPRTVTTDLNPEHPPNRQLSTFNLSNLQPLPWLFSFLLPLAPHALLSVLLGFATISAGIGLMGASAYIIAAAALHPSIAALQVAIVGVRFFGLSRAVFRYLERLASHDTTFRVLAKLRDSFYRAVEPLAPAGLDGDWPGAHSGDLLGRAITDINALESFYVRSAAPPLVALLVAVATSLFLWGFEPRLALILLVFVSLQGIAVPIGLQMLGKSPGRQLVAARSHLNVLLVDALQGMPDLLACGAAQRWQARVDASNRLALAAQARLAQLAGLQSALGVLLANLGMVAVIVLAIPRVNAGLLDGIWLPVLGLIALTSFEALLPLPLAAVHMESHRQAAARLLEIASQPPAIAEPSNPLPIPTAFTFSAKNLSFAYPNPRSSAFISASLPFTLDGITFNLLPGKHLAIVGPSGAGKSTILSLVERFYEAGNGLTLGGQPISSFSSAAIRQQIAVVSQQTYLFSATIRENLLLANPEATMQQIERAACAAQLDGWIASLPQGYDTWVGEHGLRISGGERQRIAIARALLRDAPLLLLDEPTAHLDAATEASLLDALRTLIARRSVIWISHRLVGMDWMDEILVLDAGRIVERGTHAELFARQGMYRCMWEEQG